MPLNARLAAYNHTHYFYILPRAQIITIVTGQSPGNPPVPIKATSSGTALHHFIKPYYHYNTTSYIDYPAVPPVLACTPTPNLLWHRLDTYGNHPMACPCAGLLRRYTVVFKIYMGPYYLKGNQPRRPYSPLIVFYVHSGLVYTVESRRWSIRLFINILFSCIQLQLPGFSVFLETKALR